MQSLININAFRQKYLYIVGDKQCQVQGHFYNPGNHKVFNINSSKQDMD